MNRVSFLVDGFNVYHSAKEARKDLGAGVSTLWLDLRSLFGSYVSIFGKEAALTEIYYFSALATHIDSSAPAPQENTNTILRAAEAPVSRFALGGSNTRLYAVPDAEPTTYITKNVTQLINSPILTPVYLDVVLTNPRVGRVMQPDSTHRA